MIFSYYFFNHDIDFCQIIKTEKYVRLSLQSKYKSLLVSERTTVDDLIELLLHCHNNNERIERFSIYEVSSNDHSPFDLAHRLINKLTEQNKYIIKYI